MQAREASDLLDHLEVDAVAEANMRQILGIDEKGFLALRDFARPVLPVHDPLEADLVAVQQLFELFLIGLFTEEDALVFLAPVRTPGEDVSDTVDAAQNWIRRCAGESR